VAFCDGHSAAFAFFGGVPHPSCTTTPSWLLPESWAMEIGSERVFSELQSHHLPFRLRAERPIATLVRPVT